MYDLQLCDPRTCRPAGLARDDLIKRVEEQLTIVQIHTETDPCAREAILIVSTAVTQAEGGRAVGTAAGYSESRVNLAAGIFLCWGNLTRPGRYIHQARPSPCNCTKFRSRATFVTLQGRASSKSFCTTLFHFASATKKVHVQFMISRYISRREALKSSRCARRRRRRRRGLSYSNEIFNVTPTIFDLREVKSVCRARLI